MTLTPSSEQSDSAVAAVAAANHIDDKPYHSKRPHKKSRTGCRNCKARKVKCDESRPICRNCMLRKADCVFPGPSHSHSEPGPGSPSGSSTSAVSPSRSRSHTPQGSHASIDDDYNALVLREPLYIPAGDRDATDMKLLWFYTTNTFASFATQAGQVKRVDDILKIKIPSHAFESPFLMDCLLGTSALQLQHLKQDIAPSRALRYRARAFEGYRKAIEEGKPETFPALIATSLLLTALSSQMFREEGTKDLYIIDWMIVWRGIGLMIDMATPQTLWDSGLADLFVRPPINLDEAAKHIPNNLLFMISSIRPGDPDYDHISTYYDTLKYLGSLYAALVHGFNPVMTLRVVTWFTFIPKAFVELGRQKRPRALVILAHYLMFIKVARNLWWIEGIGDREIAGIVRHLGEDWYEELAAPRLALLLDDRVDITRLILADPEWDSPVDDFKAPLHDARTEMLTWVDDSGKRYKGMPQRVGDLQPADPAPRRLPWDGDGLHQDSMMLCAPGREYAERVLEAIDMGVQDMDVSR
ncbi:C6 zinc finger domain protein [Colletotrichum higginsianum]|uniref:Sterol regulatory element-binding protein ECM22 n=1 Tax=Colletotrichum higginsianum TaxID=80884 RepID=A0A4T0VXY5_9PEZI|nr:Sterol regulatory element-binding protein ECM22 [Colletotrichum higginsianum]GJD02087.1 C6 zinc finger domain protein [Colletotrichum higginsianum]